MQNPVWCHSARAPKCHIVTTGPAWALSLLLSSSQGCAHLIYHAGVSESLTWQIGKPLPVFCPPKVRSIPREPAQTREPLELLKLCKDMNMSQQHEDEVLSTQMPQASSLKGGKIHVWLGQCRAGIPGMLWALW